MNGGALGNSDLYKSPLEVRTSLKAGNCSPLWTLLLRHLQEKKEKGPGRAGRLLDQRGAYRGEKMGLWISCC